MNNLLRVEFYKLIRNKMLWILVIVLSSLSLLLVLLPYLDEKGVLDKVDQITVEVLDEATEGLAPLIRAEIWSCLRQLKESGEAILVIDKHVEALSSIADRHVVLEKGRVVWAGNNADLKNSPEIKRQFLSM